MLISGTEASRRASEVERLNSEYVGMMEMSLNIESIYHYMVDTENYRMLSQFEYTKSERPLRSGRVLSAPPMTDVNIKLIFGFISVLWQSMYLYRLRRIHGKIMECQVQSDLDRQEDFQPIRVVFEGDRLLLPLLLLIPNDQDLLLLE